MKTKPRLVDPDIFGIIGATASILSGVELLAAFLSRIHRTTPTRIYRQQQGILDQLEDLLGHIHQDARVIHEIAETAQLSRRRSFRPERYAFLTVEQFRRYEKTSDQIMARLRKVLKLTNRLDKISSRFPFVPSQIGEMSKLEGDLDRLLHDRRQTLGEATTRLTSVTLDLKKMIADLRD